MLSKKYKRIVFMNLSQTAKYAIRILSFMAMEKNKLYTAKELVEKLNISDKYLRKIMTDISKAGLIKSSRGRGGGYVFSVTTNRIFLLDIIQAVEQTKKYTGCILGFENCSDEKPCVVHQEWVKVGKKTMEIFSKISLRELVETDFTGKF
ncbi:MAG: hypothetical protein CSB06_02025 [Bacteroidia bacterium]|nr:MAG: hypothetical protein CSB06_02025 [Bacteroidia bacterium]